MSAQEREAIAAWAAQVAAKAPPLSEAQTARLRGLLSGVLRTGRAA
ncbi:hypothetical protein [Blastococcus sp. KM273128]|nr:hypothetical protein [Blastococcus sp. KM273128]